MLTYVVRLRKIIEYVTFVFSSFTFGDDCNNNHCKVNVERCFVAADIDECELNICDQICTNHLGSYSCSCYNGYRLVNDTRCVAEGRFNVMTNSYGTFARCRSTEANLDI